MQITIHDIIKEVNEERMKIKPKKCKGTGDCKGHGCDKEHIQRKYGLCPTCLYKWSKSTDEGKEWYNKNLIRVNKPKDDLEVAKVERKQGIKLENVKKGTKDALHKFIRERDKGKPCISCSTPWKSNFQAGHCFKAELYSSLKYNLHNINGQCEQCNLRREGNEAGYLLNLPNRIGDDNYKELVRMASIDKHNTHKWDREELKKIRTNANILYKKLLFNK